MAVVTFPTADEEKRQFEAYCLALGKVAHAWNYLHEKLGRLFATILRCDPHVTNAIWYKPDSDRIKVGMLGAAISTQQDQWWLPDYPSAKDDIVWLVERVQNLADMRNNVIHAPCVLRTDGGGTAMAASFNGHERAKKLWGKEILVEFDWCERYAEELTRFAVAMETALWDRHLA